MPGLSKVVVLDPDARAGRQLRLGFEREGVPTRVVAADLDGTGAPPAELAHRVVIPGEPPGLVLVGGASGAAVELVRQTRAALDAASVEAPVVFAGAGVEPQAARAAGADEVITHPAHLRDVVTIGRLLRGRPAAQRAHMVGNLGELTGVLPLVRAFAALGRSATLTLVRGLRRGEIRFFHGEVTSAQVGLIHGRAALHQLLLWTDGRFDYHHEDIVRRHQIPLSHDELFADASRFLESVREASGGLSPSMTLQQDLPRVQSFGKQIPTEVYGVLRMFDGHRVLADVLEDSAYRVFETLRVAQRAVEIGLLRVVEPAEPRTTWRALLAIEDWLLGHEPRDLADVTVSGAIEASGAARAVEAPEERETRSKSNRKGRRNKKKRRLDTPTAVASPAGAKPAIDWGALVPRTVGAEVGPLSGVVPAEQTSGEIAWAQPAAPASGAAPPPKVVLDDGGARRDAAAKAEPSDDASRATIRAIATSVSLSEPLPALREPTLLGEPVRAADLRAADVRVADTIDVPVAAPADAIDVAVTAPTAGPSLDADVASRASAAEAHADAIRAVAATVTLSSPPVADERERSAPEASAPAQGSGAISDDAPTQRLHRDAIATAISGAVTAPVVARSLAELSVPDDPSSTRAGDTAASPATSEPPAPTATAAPATTAAPAAAAPARPGDAAPDEVADEPSDGVIRQTIATPPSGASRRRRLPTDPPDADDRPDDATGEISDKRPAPVQPHQSEPSILVADLAAVHVAASAASQAPAATPLADAGSPALEAEVLAARTDAAAFSEVEEAFFRAGHDHHDSATAPRVESFDDLDEGYEPAGFWDRLLGRRGSARRRPK